MSLTFQHSHEALFFICLRLHEHLKLNWAAELHATDSDLEFSFSTNAKWRRLKEIPWSWRRLTLQSSVRDTCSLISGISMSSFGLRDIHTNTWHLCPLWIVKQEFGLNPPLGFFRNTRGHFSWEWWSTDRSHQDTDWWSSGGDGAGNWKLQGLTHELYTLKNRSKWGLKNHFGSPKKLES